MRIAKPSEQVLNVAGQRGFACWVIEPSDADALRAQMRAKFVANKASRMWEGIAAAYADQDVQGWRRIALLVHDIPFVLLFDTLEDETMLGFPAGTDLAQLLENCTGFEFYVTDWEAAFLCAFNHHDFLVSTRPVPFLPAE